MVLCYTSVFVYLRTFVNIFLFLYYLSLFSQKPPASTSPSVDLSFWHLDVYTIVSSKIYLIHTQTLSVDLEVSRYIFVLYIYSCFSTFKGEYKEVKPVMIYQSINVQVHLGVVHQLLLDFISTSVHKTLFQVKGLSQEVDNCIDGLQPFLLVETLTPKLLHYQELLAIDP